ncbi:MAG: ShlB/FhaC/HecB family hemolysin secretion/activation protein [Hylemonella sp.]|nr:ShlB/FhaC/HecB family hemolysin secretion/activation protein [Hylemonella sp.]
MRRLTMKSRLYPLARGTLPLGAVLVALLPLGVPAQTTPGAGTLLQQIPRSAPAPAPAARPGLSIESESRGRLPPGAAFKVQAVQITGNTLFDGRTLYALVAQREGQELTLVQLQELADRITNYYQRHGYPLARAIIPAQVIRNGIVVIEVLEARYDKISLDNRSPVSTPLLEDTLSPLRDGQFIAQAKLDHALLLLSDIPGVVVNANLRPGSSVGTSDLSVLAEAGPRVAGNVTLDNYGSRYTGRGRVGGLVYINNPLHHGDVLSLSGMTSEDRGMNYGRLSYETLLSGRGTRLGAAYAALNYTLGNTLATLQGHGDAEISSLWVRHPLLRRGNASLHGQLQYDQMRLRDRLGSSAIRTDRTVDNTTLSLSGDSRDTVLSGGINNWSVNWTTGQVNIEDPVARSVDAASARTQGSYARWNAQLARLQDLGQDKALYLSLNGQWTQDNLDASKKMAAGGPYTVRAYDVGAISGDSGYFASVEYRHNLGPAWNGSWQLQVFVDSAQLEINRRPWAAGRNDAVLSGAGLGLSWSGKERWQAQAYIATPIGATPEQLAGQAATRGWINLTKGF